MSAPFYIPTSTLEGSNFSTFSPILVIISLSMIVTLVRVKWYLIVVGREPFDRSLGFGKGVWDWGGEGDQEQRQRGRNPPPPAG